MRRGPVSILLTLLVIPALLALSTVAGAQATPTIVLSPTSGAAGTPITVTVDGFLPGTVEIHIDQVDATPVASEFVSPDGDDGFTVRFLVPRSLEPGVHGAIACLNRDRSRCEQSTSAKFTVVAPPPTTTTTTTSTTTTSTVPPTSTVPTTTSTTVVPTTTPPSSIAPPPTVVVTTTTVPGNLTGTTLPPTTSLPDVIATSTTVGGDPVPPPSIGPGELGVTTTTTQLPEGQATAVADIELVAIEVTQGLQNLDNEFPLIINRPTWVRVHAITDAAGGSQANVDAAILVLRNGVEQGVLWAENGPVTIPGEMSGAARGTNDGTPYFQIPLDWTNGGGVLEVRAMVFASGVVDASNEADPDNNAGSVSVFLDEANAATIHYFPVYLEDDDGTPLVHTTDQGYLDEHMATYRIWPIGQLIAVPHQTVVGDENSDWDLSEIDGSSGPNIALAELFAESGLDESHQYAGMVHADVETHFGGFASSGTTWTQMGSGYSGWVHGSGEILAHEGGHWAGLQHAPCAFDPNESLPQEVHGGAYDATFPGTYSWPSCSLAPTHWTGFYGFDPVPSAPGTTHPAIMSNDPLAPNAAYPWMGYEGPGWTDPYHGCKMLVFLDVACDTGALTPVDPDAPNGGAVPAGGPSGVPAFDCDLDLPGDDADFCDLQLGPSGDPTAAPPSGPQQLIVGLVDNIAGNHRLDRAIELTSTADLDGRVTADPAAGGPYLLALVDDDDKVQWATTIDVDDPQAHGAIEDSPTPFAVRFPTFDDTARIVLAKPGEKLAEISATRSPTVDITQAEVVGGELAVAIDAADPDGDPVWTSVQYRPDAAAEWVPLTVGSRGTSFRFENLAELPSSDDGEILVRVTDGFSTATATRRGIVVTDQPPLVSVMAPGPGDEFTTRDAVALRAHGIDADAGGDIDALDYRWESSIDGVVGAGHTAVVRDLAPGQHTVTVVVTDAGGNEVRRDVDIVVVAAAPIDTDLLDAAAVRLRGPVDPLGPIAVDVFPATDAGSSGCETCVALALGGLTALLLAILAWRFYRPTPELAT